MNRSEIITVLDPVLKAFEELKIFYSVEVRDIEEDDEKLKITIKNRCFLREPLSHRPTLRPGKAFCRINKAYFEIALKKMIGNKVKKVDINFIEDDPENDCCIETVEFYKNNYY